MTTSKAALITLLRDVARDLEGLALSDDTGYLKARERQCRAMAAALEQFRVTESE